MRNNSKLTKRQREVYNKYKENERTVGPTVRELAAKMKTSPANIQQHLNAIRRKGWVLNGRKAS